MGNTQDGMNSEVTFLVTPESGVALNKRYRCLAAVIALDVLDDVSEIEWRTSGEFYSMTAPQQMTTLNHAYRHFIQMTREPRFQFRQRLNQGEMWCFDNRRSLHARDAFDPASGTRHF